MRHTVKLAIGVSLFTAFLASACRREERRFREVAPSTTATSVASAVNLQPGPTYTVTQTHGPYEYNAYAISEGKTLFNQFNCSGCHSNGGGGMGPPLMDDKCSRRSWKGVRMECRHGADASRIMKCGALSRT
jgi:cytochrome c oxidase cbb3-type subunit 3